MTLADLKPGDTAVIADYSTGDPPARLLEFGLLPGTTVELVRFSPLGDPMDIRVRGFHLSIRRSEAALIPVEKTRIA